MSGDLAHSATRPRMTTTHAGCVGRKSTAFMLYYSFLSEPLEMAMGNLRWLTLAALVLSAGVALGKDARIEADPFLNFVVGDYVTHDRRAQACC
jgi:hypothetical protein